MRSVLVISVCSMVSVKLDHVPRCGTLIGGVCGCSPDCCFVNRGNYSLVGFLLFFKGLCVLMWRKVKDSVSAITALTEKVNGKKMLLDKRLVVVKIFRGFQTNNPRRFDGL